MRTPRIFSFFSGAGFLDLGFERNGFDVALVNEIFEPFVDAYRYSRQKMNIAEPRLGYIIEGIDSLCTTQGIALLQEMAAKERLSGAPLGFIGGPPCPDFSVAGKNKGSLGSNGRLSRSYVELICAVKPDFFMFENVKGLWRTARHRTFFEELKSQLVEAGYVITNRLINSIEYAAPQDRDRIILFGVLSSSLKNPAMQSPQLDAAFQWEKELIYPNRSAFQNFEWPGTDVQVSADRKPLSVGPEELTIAHWFRRNDVENHVNAHDAFTPRAGLSKFMSVLEGDVSKKSYKRLHRNRYSPTAAYGNNEVHIHPTQARRISVAEALAIQSLPKEFCLPPTMTLTNKFKTIGNGVPYLAASGLAKTIAQFIKEHVRETDSREPSKSRIQIAKTKVVRVHQRSIWDESTRNQRQAA